MVSEHYAELTSSCVFLAPNRHQKNFSQTFESPRVTLTDVAFPLPDLAALCLSLLIRCISWHYPSLPLHIGAAHLLARSRLTFAFQSVPMQSLSITLRGIPLRFPCRPHFDLHRFPFANPCIASRFHALAAPGHTIHCADASQRSTLPCITFAWLLASQLILCIPQQ